MLTVLIVEDEPKIRDMAERSLSAEYRTFTARNATEALALLRDHPEVDLLFTDAHLGAPTSGIGLARMARRMRPDLKVLYATNRRDELLGLESPIDPTQIIAKPYQATDVRRAVGWLLQPPA